MIIKVFKNGKARVYTSTYMGLELVGRFDTEQEAVETMRKKGFDVRVVKR